MTADKPLPKRRVAISMDPELFDWLEQRVGPDRRGGAMTHAIETAVMRMKRGMN